MPACPAVLISAPASGQGKTTMTAALARYHQRQGRRVRVFKTGPDFLDPMILARASGAPVYSLDLWMVGEAECRRLLADAARNADLILIEAMMGLFDGKPSSADLAARFGVPVIVVISAQAMAQTFGAIALGLAHFSPRVALFGVLANRVNSDRHAQMLKDALPAGLRWLGHLSGADNIELPNCHLGLRLANKISDLDRRLNRASEAIARTGLIHLPPPVTFAASERPSYPRLLNGVRIAIARDDAFSFIYPANVDLLRALGAQIRFFSPLANEALPDGADALYLPGGYPEWHAEPLAQHTHCAASIRAHAALGKPIFAECGGMLYLLERLTDGEGITTPMLGLMPGHAVMQTKPASLAMQQLDSIDGTITGHTFHYSRMTTTLTPWLTARHPLSGAQGEPLFRHGAIIATYLHLYWPSNPIFTARLLRGHLSDRVGICTVSHPIAAANDFKGVESDAGQDAL